MSKPAEYQYLNDKAMRCLALREHSRNELGAKLRATGAEASLISDVLNALQTDGYLSDERYTEHYIYSRMNKGRGPLCIRAELLARGVASEIITEGLAAVEEEWEEYLVKVVERKFGSPVRDKKAQARQARFLHRRGFPESMIRRYLWDMA
jgi:regulatory protein